ncbi:MAG TPA: DUF4386 domain-containing protein [Candidatus Angelobacter sp.]|nr:DUF4386 domain-containing protein [Candidatus Angelobacter sp.]
MTPLSKNARIAGFLYILASAVGIVRLLYIPKVLFVQGDATATAGNIAAHESLFRLGMACYLIGGVIWLFVPLALYRLLKDVDRGLAVLMVILGSLMQVPAYIVNTATDAVALLLARGGEFLTVFDKAQREALAMVFLRLHHHIDVADIVFAGLWLLPFGLLVYRSRFLPRLLGVWLMLACFAWVAFCLTGLLFPGYEDKVFNYGQIFSLGEVATMLWLVIVGAREPSTAAG